MSVEDNLNELGSIAPYQSGGGCKYIGIAYQWLNQRFYPCLLTDKHLGEHSGGSNIAYWIEEPGACERCDNYSKCHTCGQWTHSYINPRTDWHGCDGECRGMEPEGVAGWFR
jgi:hypothetical protein